MSALQELPNVGRVLEQNLLAVGIDTPAALRAVGTEEAFRRIRTVDPGACLQMLYGLAGAVAGVPDKALTAADKSALKQFYKTL